MIVLGDVAYPDNDLSVNLSKQENIILNCEGYLVNSSAIPEDARQGVFNNVNALSAFPCSTLTLALANNHVMDSPTGALDSISIAMQNNYLTVGAGGSIVEALKPLVLREGDTEIAVIAAGWSVIGCKPATRTRQGVAPFLDQHLIPLIQEQKASGRKVLVYLHWCYELEIYPHPAHRESAKRYIDSGADLILGCHSHCLQGYESYKGKLIFYGLGNAVFREGHYWGGRLKFPEICRSGLAISWAPDTEQVSVASVTLEEQKVVFSDFIEPAQYMALTELSTFAGLSKREYIGFFKKNRRKRKLLPIFKERDSSLGYQVKVLFVSFRAFLIGSLFRLGLKGQSR